METKKEFDVVDSVRRSINIWHKVDRELKIIKKVGENAPLLYRINRELVARYRSEFIEVVNNSDCTDSKKQDMIQYINDCYEEEFNRKPTEEYINCK